MDTRRRDSAGLHPSLADIDFPRFLETLAAKRPIFHSEADLQHEVAWHLREAYPQIHVRLEYPLAPLKKAAIDILVRDGDDLLAP